MLFIHNSCTVYAVTQSSQVGPSWMREIWCHQWSLVSEVPPRMSSCIWFSWAVVY